MGIYDTLKPAVREELVSLSENLRRKLREAGQRVLEIGALLARAKTLIPQGKLFESWCLGECGLSLATAYRWIQASETAETLKLYQTPDLLEPSDVGELISVSFPNSLRQRVFKRLEMLRRVEAQAGELRKELQAEQKKLGSVEEKAKAAKAEFDKAAAKAVEKVKPLKDSAEGYGSQVRDARERVTDLQARIRQAEAEARAKLTEAQADVQAQKRTVAEKAAAVGQAETKAGEAREAVKTEAQAVQAEAQAKRRPEAPKADGKGADAFRRFAEQWCQTLAQKAREMVTDPRERSRELQAVAAKIEAVAKVAAQEKAA